MCVHGFVGPAKQGVAELGRPGADEPEGGCDVERGGVDDDGLGKDGGQAAGLALKNIIAPGKTADRIQELHMLILHIAIEHGERILFPENY